MKKKLICAVLAVLIAFVCMPAISGAGADIYYTAVNDTLLSLKASTMPVEIEDTLYVPFSVFNNNTLRIYYTNDKENHLFSLYNGKNDRITFDLNSGRCTDDNNIVYWYKAINRNSTIYVPVNFVCQFFDLTYTLIEGGSYNPIIRVRDDAAALSDTDFLKSAESLLKTRLEEYQSESGGSSNPPDSSPPGGVNDPSKARIYLSFEGIGDYTADILDVFDSYSYKGTFFLTENEIIENSNIVRRILGSGHTVGIMIESDLESEYIAGAEALFTVSKEKTLLIGTGGAVDRSFSDQAGEQGLLLWGYSVSAKNASSSDTVITSIGLAGSRCDVRFDAGSRTSGVLSDVLRFLNRNGYGTRRATETEAPYVRYSG